MLIYSFLFGGKYKETGLSRVRMDIGAELCNKQKKINARNDLGQKMKKKINALSVPPPPQTRSIIFFSFFLFFFIELPAEILHFATKKCRLCYSWCKFGLKARLDSGKRKKKKSHATLSRALQPNSALLSRALRSQFLPDRRGHYSPTLPDRRGHFGAQLCNSVGGTSRPNFIR